MLEVLSDITLIQGVTVKKGAYVAMDGVGNIIIKRGDEEYVWSHNTYVLYNAVRAQHGLDEI